MVSMSIWKSLGPLRFTRSPISQGDPLGVLLFSGAIQDALKKISQLLKRTHAAAARTDPTLVDEDPGTVLAYMDYCTIAVHLSLANQIAFELARIFEQAALALNDAKCGIVGPLSRAITAPYFKIAPDGDIILRNSTG